MKTCSYVQIEDERKLDKLAKDKLARDLEQARQAKNRLEDQIQVGSFIIATNMVIRGGSTRKGMIVPTMY